MMKTSETGEMVSTRGQVRRQLWQEQEGGETGETGETGKADEPQLTDGLEKLQKTHADLKRNGETMNALAKLAREVKTEWERRMYQRRCEELRKETLRSVDEAEQATRKTLGQTKSTLRARERMRKTMRELGKTTLSPDREREEERSHEPSSSRVEDTRTSESCEPNRVGNTQMAESYGLDPGGAVNTRVGNTQMIGSCGNDPDRVVNTRITGETNTDGEIEILQTTEQKSIGDFLDVARNESFLDIAQPLSQLTDGGGQQERELDLNGQQVFAERNVREGRTLGGT